MQRSKVVCWVLLMLFSILGYAVKPVPAVKVPAKITPPQIFNISPASGPAAGGQLVTISGMNFTPNPTVTFGGSAAPILFATATQIVVSVPSGNPGNVSVLVTASGNVSNVATYTYAGPVITNISPASGPTAGGQIVTIMGSNFNASALVTFGGAVAPINSVTATRILVTAPPGASGNVSVLVTVAGSVSNAATYTYGVPVIANISPASGPSAGGQIVTIMGSNFNGSPVVTFGGTAAPINSATNTQIVVTTPAGSPGNVSVVVTVAGVVSNAVSYNYALPVITNLSPTVGPDNGGQIVTISGSNFTPNPMVTFGGVVAPVNSATNTQIIVTTPPGSPGIANVLVTVAGNTSNSFPYTYVTDPVITNMSPAAGPIVGTQTVTITGTSFVSGATTVSFGGTAGTNVTVSSSTQLVVTTPAHSAGIVNVTVTTVGGVSNSLNYNYEANAPIIVSVNPSSGPASGGQAVTISGVDFAPSSNIVLLGGNVAPILSENINQIVVISPAGSVGNVQVEVSASGVVSNSFPYTYN